VGNTESSGRKSDGIQPFRSAFTDGTNTKKCSYSGAGFQKFQKGNNDVGVGGQLRK